MEEIPLLVKMRHTNVVPQGTVRRIRTLFETTAIENTPPVSPILKTGRYRDRNIPSPFPRPIPGALEFNNEEILCFPRWKLMELAEHYRKLCREANELELFICTDILKVPPSTKNEEKEILSLDDVRNLRGNETCADCNSPDTSWASTNLGVFLCIRCSGVHRSLGVHISTVFSCTLDIWTSKRVSFMQENGNEKINQIYEYHLAKKNLLALKPKQNSLMTERELFIKAKYVTQLFHKNHGRDLEGFLKRRAQLIADGNRSISQSLMRSPERKLTSSMEQLAMIEYCGIIFIGVKSLRRSRTKKPTIDVKLKSLRFLAFTLGKQIVHVKSLGSEEQATARLNIPVTHKILTIKLQKRTHRLSRDVLTQSEITIDLSEDRFLDNTADLNLVFPGTKLTIQLSITLELLS